MQKETCLGTSPSGPVAKTLSLPVQGAQVQSPAWELRSCVPHGMTHTILKIKIKKKRKRRAWAGRGGQVWGAVGAVAQSCLTLCNPMDCSPPGSSARGIFQARILGWVAISSSRGSSQPRDGTRISWVSCTGRRILYHCKIDLVWTSNQVSAFLRKQDLALLWGFLA